MSLVWRTEWRAIDARIRGLLEAATIYFRGESISSDDAYGTSRKQILPHTREIFQAIDNLGSRHCEALPHGAHVCLTRFLNENRSLFGESDLHGLPVVKSVLTALAAFRSEFEYHISDFDTVAKRLVERGFLHLQRSIVADADIAHKWRQAFAKGEVACEKLGAVHLLGHGIWAFKVSGEGERTDLVLGEAFEDLSVIDRTADALVLTEWKRISEPSELDAKAAAALTQARLYAAGVLGGVEIASVRYLVLVSKRRLMMPDDVTGDDGVIYHYINVAVEPATPSQQAL